MKMYKRINGKVERVKPVKPDHPLLNFEKSEAVDYPDEVFRASTSTKTKLIIGIKKVGV